MFDLAVAGITRLRRLAPFAERPVAWEPLSGLVDGSNKRFRVRQGPIKADTLTAYVSDVSVTKTVVSPDVVLLSTAPAAQPYASYTHQPLTTLQAKQLLMDGVTELEMRWSRGLRMSSSNATYVAAAETDDHIYVIAKSTVTDPSDEVALSTSETQLGLLLSCTSYVYRLSDLLVASLAAISVRGTAGGMTLDRRAIPTALLQVLALLDLRLRRQIVNAQSEWTDGESLGGTFDPIMTRDYMNEYEWQSAAVLQNWYNTYRYTPSDVDLLAIT